MLTEAELEAVAESKGSVRPRTDGTGLNPAEHGKLLTTRFGTVRRFAMFNDGPSDRYLDDVVAVAVGVALRVVLAGRPRIEPEPTPPADDDPWAEYDMFRWTLGPASGDGDHIDPPSPEDERWAVECRGRG